MDPFLTAGIPSTKKNELEISSACRPKNKEPPPPQNSEALKHAKQCNRLFLYFSPSFSLFLLQLGYLSAVLDFISCIGQFYKMVGKFIIKIIGLT